MALHGGGSSRAHRRNGASGIGPGCSGEAVADEAILLSRGIPLPDRFLTDDDDVADVPRCPTADEGKTSPNRGGSLGACL